VVDEAGTGATQPCSDTSPPPARPCSALRRRCSDPDGGELLEAADCGGAADGGGVVGDGGEKISV
jgi:hypothetical protein